jgi:putative membrane protein
MLFIDFVTLLLVNMTAGFVLLAGLVALGLDKPDPRRWVPGFLVVGLMATVFGGYMTVTWPLPGPFSSAYGEMSVLFGVIFLGAALAMALGWELTTVGVYAFFAGLAAMLIGVRILNLGLTLQPLLAGVGFILSGLGGVFAAPTLLWLGKSLPFRYAAALVLLAAAGIWALTAYGAYWQHIEHFSKWVPVVHLGP